MAKGEAPSTKRHWCAEVEKKASRGRLWRMLERDQYIQGMLAYFSSERLKAKRFMNEAEKEKQEETQSQRRRESPAKEYLEQVKCCKDSDCTPSMMKLAFLR